MKIMKWLLITILIFTSISFGKTIYVDMDNNGGTEDGTTAGTAWGTLAEAADDADDGDLVYVKASQNYDLQDGATGYVVAIDDAGALGAPITWIGCADLADVNDGGVVTVDADDATLTGAVLCTGAYNVFYNFYFVGGSGVGFMANGVNNLKFFNCRFGDNDADGFDGDNNINLVNCLFDGNGAKGAECGNNTIVKAGIFYNNAQQGCDTLTDATVSQSVFSENAGDQLRINGLSGSVTNCIFDGNDVASSDGIYLEHATASYALITDNIFIDCVYGITAVIDIGYNAVSANNMYYSSGTAPTNNFVAPTDVLAKLHGDFIATSNPFATTGAIADLDAMLDRYILHTTNVPEAGGKGGGRDASVAMDFWDDFLATTNPPGNAETPNSEVDIGARQLVDPAGGGTTYNIKSANKNGGKQ